MANKAVFVSDFRSAMTAFLICYERLTLLTSFCMIVSWVEEDFESALTGADINETEFYAAVTSVSSLIAAVGEVQEVIEKLKP